MGKYGFTALAYLLLLVISVYGGHQNITIPLMPQETISDAAVLESSPETAKNTMRLQIGENLFTVTLTDNSSAAALKDLLATGPITIDMRDYGNMEKVGDLGMNLPTHDEQMTTEPGDLILYQGRSFVIYYAPNSWSLTRLGKIDDVTAAELKEVLGDGNVTVILSLEPEHS